MPLKNVPALQVLGKLTFEPTDPPRPPGAYVLQRVAPGRGNVAADPTGSLQVRRYVLGTNPRTPAQLALRARVRQGNVAWHALTPTEKADWTPKGAGRRITGYNAFISAWLLGLLSGPPIPDRSHGTRRGPVARALVGQPLGTLPGHITIHHQATRAITYTPFGSKPAHSVHVAPRMTRAPDPARGALVVAPSLRWLALSDMPGRTRGTLRTHSGGHRLRKV
jgi:hypothetical protein